MYAELADASSLIARVLDVPLDLASDASIYTLDEWDSLAHVRIILEIEKAVGAELDTEQVLSVERTEDVARVLLFFNSSK